MNMEDRATVEGSGFTMSPAVVDRPSSPERSDEDPKPIEKTQRLEPLFPPNETQDLRANWHQIQGDFVEEPKRAVEQADQLVARVIQRLATEFTSERKRLEQGWAKEGNGSTEASTEDLRQALRRYRAFFDRLLSL